MIKKLCHASLLMLLCCSVFVLSVHAQEAEDVDFASGFIKEVSADFIIIEDVEAGQSSITLKINKDTLFENITAISEIVVGDEVYVDYTESNGENIALSVYKMGADEENIEMDDQAAVGQ